LVNAWFAPQASVKIAAAIATVAPDTSLSAQQATPVDFSGEVKNLSISGGERDVDALKFLGYNETHDFKRATVVECSFTMVHIDKDTGEFLMGPAQTVGATAFKRIQGGEKAANDRTAKSVLIQLTDGTNTVNILLNNAYATTREFSLAADGHMEETITFKCLASDYYEEDDF